MRGNAWRKGHVTFPLESVATTPMRCEHCGCWHSSLVCRCQELGEDPILLYGSPHPRRSRDDHPWRGWIRMGPPLYTNTGHIRRYDP